MSKQTFLVLVRAAPYGNHQARAAIDLALTAAAFEQQVAFVFLDAGVLQLLEVQDTTASGMKNISNMLAALPLYDVESVLVHSPSAAVHGIDTDILPDPVDTIDDTGLREMLAAADQVMVF